jgi:putative restriction endonuclease
MDRAELLDLLGRLRQAQVGGLRAPHKPLLLLWLFGRFAATGSTSVSYKEAEEPVSHLINQFGTPISRPSTANQLKRAAQPFVHLERKLWDLRKATGAPIGPEADESRRQLLDCSAVGRLHESVETLLADPTTLADATRLLLDQHFTPTLASLICDTVSLDLSALQELAVEVDGVRLRRQVRRVRRPEFSETVLHAYAFACAVCGFDGALGRTPVGIEAAHVRWHSQGGPDDVANGLALCALHHKLLDLGVIGLAADDHGHQGHHVKISALYVARSEAGRALYALDGRQLASPRPGQPEIDPVHIAWHDRQVFRGPSPHD